MHNKLFKNLTNKFDKKFNFKYIIYAMLFVAVILLFLTLLKSKTARSIIYIGIFILINAVISSYKRFIKIPIEIEFMTLGIVLITFNFGIKAGLIFAIFGGIISFIVGFNISPFSFPMLLGYILMVFSTFLLQELSFSLVFIGIISSIINNLFVFLFYHIVFDYNLIKNLSFSISNFIFNFIVFISFLDFFLKFVY